jgi:hypothetical protein
MDQRQRGAALDQLVGAERRGRRPGADPGLGHRLLHRPVTRSLHQEAEARAHGQEVAQRERAVGRHGVVKRAVDRAQDLAVGELRQPAVDRIVEPDLRLLDQNHRGYGGDRLGHRGDAEERVAPHRLAASGRLQADRIDMHRAPPAHRHDDARHLAALDVTRHDLVHPAEPCSGQSAAAHAPASRVNSASIRISTASLTPIEEPGAGTPSAMPKRERSSEPCAEKPMRAPNGSRGWPA